MFTHHLVALLGLYIALAATPATAGTLRVDLPELLGDYEYDGGRESGNRRTVTLNMPFRVYSISEARIVIAGTTTPGKGRGDGVLREASAFDLLPSGSPSFHPQLNVRDLFAVKMDVGDFIVDRTLVTPLHPAVTPLPCLCETPPIYITAGMSLGLNELITNFPPWIGDRIPGHLYRASDGIVYETPIRAQVTEAYLVLTGRGVVPEPRTAWLLTVILVFVGTQRRFGELRWLKYQHPTRYPPLAIS
jgi:hypothetical protein